jgi:hypothetical protein
MKNYQVSFQDSPYALENGIREAILQRDYAKGLVVLEGLYRLKLAGDTWLTFKEIYTLLCDNFQMSYQLVYQGLQTVMLFQRRKAEGIAYQKGARPYLYRIPYPQELKAEYAPDSKPTPSDRLIRTDLRTVAAYRQGLHRELYLRLWIANDGHGFTMYRELQAERLNVSVRTIRTYDKTLGFSHEANYLETEITDENWNTLPRYKNQYDESGKRLPSRKWLKVVDWKTGKTETLPYVRYLAYINLQEQKAVYEVERTANTYYPYIIPQIDLSECDYDPMVPYLADLKAKNAAGLYRDSDGNWHYTKKEQPTGQGLHGFWQNTDGEWYFKGR